MVWFVFYGFFVRLNFCSFVRLVLYTPFMSRSWYSKTILDTGLPVLVAPTDSPSVTAVFMVKTGSKNEELPQAGISHFLEHFVFKGTKKYPTSRDVMRALDSVGASHNASTGKEFTMYWVKASKANLARAIEILGEIVFRPLLPEKLLSREKGTILQEIAMYEDHPMIKVEERFENLLYGKDSRLGRDIIGMPKTVSGLTREQLVAYRQRWYGPGNVVFAVAGGARGRDVVKLAEKEFGEFAFSSAGPAARHPAPTQLRQGFDGQASPPESMLDLPLRSVRVGGAGARLASPRRLIDFRKTDQAHLVFGVHALARLDPRRYALSILLTILGGNASSQLFEQVREQRGLAYYVRAGATRYDEAGYASIRAGVPPEKAREVLDLVRQIVFQFKTNKTEFSEAREFLKGQLALGWEDSSHVAEHLAEEFLAEAHVRSMGEITEKLDAVKLSDVLTLAEELFRDPDDLYVAAMGPVDEKLQVTRNKEQA